jgi:crooked neck
VQKQMPRKIKKRRKMDDDTYEEYNDYVFPAEDKDTKKLSDLLALAQKWKQGGGTISGDAANGD